MRLDCVEEVPDVLKTGGQAVIVSDMKDFDATVKQVALDCGSQRPATLQQTTYTLDWGSIR
jgi:hypothetical protein